MKKICVGILGLGTVGNGVANLLDEQRRLIKRRLGVEVCVSKIADRSIFTKNKTARGVAAENLGTDFEAVIDAPDVHVVAELIGGTDDARPSTGRRYSPRRRRRAVRWVSRRPSRAAFR